MGAACACSRSDTELSDFWQKIQLRNINSKDWKDIVKHKQDKSGETNNILEKNFTSVINLNLSQVERKECSEKIFVNAMKKSEALNSQRYLILSLIFLCAKDTSQDSKEVMQVFIDLSNEYAFKNSFRTDENGTQFVSKEKLMEILTFYVDLISLFGVSILYSGKKEITDSLEQIYAEEIQKKYIAECLLKDYHEDYVNLNLFFINQYPMLCHDEGIRESLWIIHENKVVLALQKKAAEAKLAAEKKAAEAKLEAEKKAAEVKLEAEKKAAEAKILADKKAAEAKIAAEKKASEAKLALEEKATAEKLKAEKKAADLKVLAEKKAVEAKLAAENKAAEAKLAAEKKAAMAEHEAAKAKIAAEKKASEAKLALEEKASAEKLKAEKKAADLKVLADKKAVEAKLAAENKAAEAKLAAEKKAAMAEHEAAKALEDSKKKTSEILVDFKKTIESNVSERAEKLFPIENSINNIIQDK